jgi:putative salt-induced outer membrane protein
MMKKILGIAVLSALSLGAQAQGWTGQGEFGLVLSNGNADNLTVNGKLDFKFEEEQWLYNVYGLALRAESSDVNTANRYELGGKAGYKFNERAYMFGSGRYENDDFAPYEYQATVAVGFGYKAIDDEATQLSFEAGPGYRRYQPVGAQICVPEEPQLCNPDAEGDFVGRGFMDFKHKLTENTSLFDTLLIEGGKDNTFAQNDFGVQVSMSEKFAIKAGIQVRHNTDVIAPIKKTDTLTTVNLVYGF